MTIDQIKEMVKGEQYDFLRKGEDVCVTCYERGGVKPLFLITTKPLTGYFFLYEFTGDCARIISLRNSSR